MRTSQTLKNSVLLLWVAFLGNSAANSPSASFSLGMPYGINPASIPYLHLSALEMAPKCDDANATMKSYRTLVERLSTIANMIETTDAHTNVPAGSNKDTHTTSNDVEAGSQNNQPVSQRRVYLGNENPEGCPTDVDTPFCHECGGDKGSPDGVSRCRGIAEQNMFLEDCLCEDVENNHSPPLKRTSRAERLRRWPEHEEVLKEIEEYGDEDEPIDSNEDIIEVEDIDSGQCSEAEVEVSQDIAPTARRCYSMHVSLINNVPPDRATVGLITYWSALLDMNGDVTSRHGFDTSYHPHLVQPKPRIEEMTRKSRTILIVKIVAWIGHAFHVGVHRCLGSCDYPADFDL